MKRIRDFLVNTPSALFLLAAGVVLLICALIPPLHGIAWLLLIIGVLVLSGTIVGWSLTWTHLQSRIDQIASEAADAYETYTPVELSQTPQEELARADSLTASDIVERFPENEGLIRRLRIEAEVSEFPDDLTAPLTAFLSDYSHTRLDEPHAHRAFMSFYRSGRALDAWIRSETDVIDGQRVLVPGDRRDGGWQAFGDAKRAGEDRADDFLAARAEFSRVVLVRRILES